MSQSITFHATIHGVRVDKEGETRLTLTIPKSDLAGPVSALTALEKLLIVTIDEEQING